MPGVALMDKADCIFDFALRSQTGGTLNLSELQAIACQPIY